MNVYNFAVYVTMLEENNSNEDCDYVTSIVEQFVSIHYSNAFQAAQKRCKELSSSVPDQYTGGTFNVAAGPHTTIV